MSDNYGQPRWQSRLEAMDCEIDAIRFLGINGNEIAQDEEWCEVVVAGQARRIRCHNYHEVFDIAGLYERLYYQRLKCCSPTRVVRLFGDVLEDFTDDLSDLRVLDVGAGNGMVGDELRARKVDTVVGIDILREAKEAAGRDRPGVYDDYLVADLTDLAEDEADRLRRRKFNCLVTVSALGFGDIPPEAFLNALSLIETPGWVVFNIKEDFLSEEDGTGFCRVIREMNRRKIIQFQAYRRYRHRLSITGKPLYYVAVAARKLEDVPADILAGEPCLAAPGDDR